VAAPFEDRLMRVATLVFAGVLGLGLFEAASAAIIPAKAVVAQVLLERAFERSVAAHRAVKPWPWADMAPVARITIPRLAIRDIALDSGSGQALAFGPTVLPNGARLGRNGTAVIAAHRDTHFRHLGQVRIGDRVVVEGIDGRVTAYRVDSTQVTRWDRFAVSSDRSSARLALVTCYPFGATVHGPLRYVVHGTRI
jgi:sortase A